MESIQIGINKKIKISGIKNEKQVKTAFKIADVEFVSGSTKLNFNYLKDLKDENGKALSQKILSENVARVYLIVVDGEIKKIGGSQAAEGIKSTLEIYRDGEVKWATKY